MRLLKLNIATRLIWGFCISLFFTLAIGTVGFLGIKELNSKIEQIVSFNNAKMDLAATMAMAVTQREISVLQLLLAANRSEQEKIIEKFNWQITAYDEANSSLTELIKSSATRLEENIIVKINEDAAVVSPLLSQAIELMKAEKNEDAQILWSEKIKPALGNWVVDLNELISIERNLNDAAIVETQSNYARNRNLIVICVALASILSGLMSWALIRSIVRPLKDAIRVAKTVAKGDLTSDIQTNATDETGQLMQALRDMNVSLLGIVSDVRSSAETITSASSQIAAGNLNLSSRTEEQASSLEETASSMEELTSTVQQNAENAHLANRLAASASEVASKGGAVVSQVVDTMDSINESANKIVDIIGVIDGIAFQTNILALNAAVEAARAGEQGRGFAVVAAEVRNLAQRSATAAKEIKALISNSVEKVDLGAKLVDQAGTTMNEIVTSVKRVTDIIGEITSASQEQTAGIEQINQAICQMDMMTQQNAALVEEASAAAASMQDQTVNLTRAVSMFNLSSPKLIGLANPVA